MGQTLHPSHHMGWVGGLIYCTLCGLYTTQEVKGLTGKCDLKPAHPVAKCRLKRIQNGEHPIKGQHLPEVEREAPFALR